MTYTRSHTLPNGLLSIIGNSAANAARGIKETMGAQPLANVSNHKIAANQNSTYNSFNENMRIVTKTETPVYRDFTASMGLGQPQPKSKDITNRLALVKTHSTNGSHIFAFEKKPKSTASFVYTMGK